MFVDAIKKVRNFTRPLQTITRAYGQKEVNPGLSTLFFVNDQGDAVTCKHVAQLIPAAQQKAQQYKKFKEQLSEIPEDHQYHDRFEALLKEYRFTQQTVVQIKNNFVGAVHPVKKIQVIPHATLDLAILRFRDFEERRYRGHAVFLKDPAEIEQGKSLCRLGFPFPEYRNFGYQQDKDSIYFDQNTPPNIPMFPMDGMVTRNVKIGERVAAIELSRPGLKGQSGGPLFDEKGRIFGMQQSTKHLHLGFDIENKKIMSRSGPKKVNDYAFLHLGQCLRSDVIVDFLKANNIEYHQA